MRTSDLSSYLTKTSASSTYVTISSLNQGVSPYYNTIYGNNSGTALTTGTHNVIVGYSAATLKTTGNNNIIIGYNAYSSTTTGSNEITLGNSSITTLRCNATTITSLSDARDKKNIESIPVGLEFISKLNPVKFTWDMRDGGKKDIDEFGFIAQDLKSVQEDQNVVYPNLVYENNPEKLEASYQVLIPCLVKGIQELKEIVVKQQKEIDSLKNKI